MYDVSCVYVYAHVSVCASVVCVCVQYECVYDVLHIVICISIVYSYMYSNNVYQCNVISM